jgi:dTDP-4-amino-4,6-dideoxygalactose transaminase
MGRFVVARNPVFSPRLLFGKESGLSPFKWAGGLVTTHTLGRFALSRGVKALGLNGEDEVLVPEFHCTHLVDAVQAAGVRTVFYRVREKGEVNLSDAEARLTERSRALLIVHYFGLQQNAPAVREWCDGHGLFLIEDCAHSLLGSLEGRPLGSWGDLSVFSVYKILPSVDGGLMVLKEAGRKDALDGRRQGLRALAKGAVKGCVLHRWPAMQGHDPAEEGVRMHPLSERVLRCADAERVVERRYSNYAYLAGALRDGGLFTPFVPDPPAGACPFLFPFRVARDVRRVHAELVERGIPITVFPERLHESFPREAFPLACELQDSLLCLPCHQDLSTADLDAMLGIMGSVK